MFSTTKKKKAPLNEQTPTKRARSTSAPSPKSKASSSSFSSSHITTTTAAATTLNLSEDQLFSVVKYAVEEQAKETIQPYKEQVSILKESNTLLRKENEELKEKYAELEEELMLKDKSLQQTKIHLISAKAQVALLERLVSNANAVLASFLPPGLDD